MQCSTAIDFFNDGVLNDPMMATNHATHDLKLSTRRSGVWGSPSVFQADSLGTVADSGGTVYWLYLLEYSDSDSFETRFWQPLCRRSHFTVVAEHGRSGTKSADTISVDPDLSGGCRYPIFEAPGKEKPSPITLGKGRLQNETSAFFTRKKREGSNNSTYFEHIFDFLLENNSARLRLASCSTARPRRDVHSAASNSLSRWIF